MGVQGLWSIIHCSGKDIDIRTLEGKVLAIDLSIWLNQALKSSNESPSPHLQLLFNRICKLLYYKIKPVFVFDGPFPSIKKRALESRRKIRQLKNDRVEEIKANIVNVLMKRNIIEKKAIPLKRKKEISDIFQIPEEFPVSSDVPQTTDCEFLNIAADYISNFNSIEDVDVDSECFHVLPLEVRHEILKTITKEKRYGLDSGQGNYNDLNSNAFSDLQIKRLLDRNSLYQRIDDIRSTMNERDCRNIIDSSKLRGFNEDLTRSSISAKKIISHPNGYLMMIDQPDDDLIASLSSTKREAMLDKVKNNLKEEDSDKKLEDDIEYSFEESEASLNEQDMSCIMESVSKLKKNNEDSLVSTTFGKSDADILSTSKTSSLHEKPLVDKAVIQIITNDENSFKGLSVPLINEATSMNDPSTEINPDLSQEILTCHTYADVEESENEETESDTDFIDVPEIDDLVSSDHLSKVNNDPDPELQKLIDDSLINELLASKVISEQSANDTYFSQFDNQNFINNPQAWRASSDALLSNLYTEESKMENQAVSVSEHYFQEAKELLKLFGIPFIESPAEAEAQCAFLETIGITNGSVTEDSDIWLFGGNTVYKHMFTSGFSIREYNSKDIYKTLGLNRDLMICIALLSGGDYAPGIYGVGPVNAMEILAEFSDPDTSLTNFEVLQHYKKWWEENKNGKKVSDKSGRKRFLRFDLDKDFPDASAYEAYNNPLVDESKEPLMWSPPSIDKLIEFVYSKIGWDKLKIIEKLKTALQNSAQSSLNQKKITDFFDPSDTDYWNLPSKRLKKATSQRNLIVKNSLNKSK